MTGQSQDLPGHRRPCPQSRSGTLAVGNSWSCLLLRKRRTEDCQVRQQKSLRRRQLTCSSTRKRPAKYQGKVEQGIQSYQEAWAPGSANALATSSAHSAKVLVKINKSLSSKQQARAAVTVIQHSMHVAQGTLTGCACSRQS